MSLRLEPLWWQTTVARVLFGAVLLLITWWAWRAIIQRERLKSNLKLEQMEREKEHIQLEKAQEIDKAKTAFLTNISHEFRTPLTLIKGPNTKSLRGILEQTKSQGAAGSSPAQCRPSFETHQSIA
jgi:signal transduction histidine kinase